MDDLGFFKTPNGSFWDPDEEYFNRYGFDIHAGCYSKDLEYIPGPDWLPEIGCYPDEKEKYTNMKFEEFDEDVEMADDLPDEFKGDFEDENLDEEISTGDILNKLQIDDKKLLEKYLGTTDLANLQNILPIKNKKTKKSKAKPKKKEQDSDDGWETIEEDDDL